MAATPAWRRQTSSLSSTPSPTASVSIARASRWVATTWAPTRGPHWTQPRQWTDGSAQLVPDSIWGGTTAPHGDILVAVTLDPQRIQETMVHVPLAGPGLTEQDAYVVHDLLTGARYTWRGTRNYVRLDPNTGQVGHVFRVEGLG